MSERLRDAVFSGVKWNAMGKFGHYGAQFFVSIVLARLLMPEEFGLIGMLAIFTAIAQAFIVSGMSSALIQKKDADSTDYSTVFYYNIGIAILFYFILFFSAKSIAAFYEEPQLIKLTKYIALVFIINGFGTVQSTILRKELNFKKLNIISVISVVIAGSIAIVMAFNNYGVYAIVGQSLSYAFITNLLYWLTSKWKPKLVFSKRSFKTLFGFGSKLLLSALLNQIYKNLSTLIIGKAFSAAQLGYFTRAKATRDIPIQNTTGILNNLIFPIFAKSKSDEDLVRHHLKFIGLIAYVVFPLMIGLAIVAEPLTVLLFSDKWLPSVPILQLLCIAGPTFPLSVILTSTILAKGKSGLFLKLDIYKKVFGLTAMLVGLYFGFYPFLIGLLVASLGSLFLNAVFTGKLLHVAIFNYLKHMLPSLLLSFFMGVLLLVIQYFLPKNYVIQLFSLSILGVIIYIGFSHIFKLNDYFYLKNLAKEKLFKKTKVKL